MEDKSENKVFVSICEYRGFWVVVKLSFTTHKKNVTKKQILIQEKGLQEKIVL